MVRSVLDTLVSFYFHNKKHHQRYNKEIISFIKDSKYGIHRWINYMNSWSKKINSDDLIIITYEEMHVAPHDRIKVILEYLNIEYDKSIVDKSLQLSSFYKMQIIEINKGILDHKHDRKDQEARRIRNGLVGGYKEYLDADAIKYINSQIEIYLHPSVKKILSKKKIIKPI